MSEIAKLLRLAAQSDKEFKITSVVVRGAPTKFTSQLTEGYLRKKFVAYNNSASGSGEIVYGNSLDSGISGKGMIVKKGVMTDLPIAASLDIYFSNTVSGENCNLRVFEGA